MSQITRSQKRVAPPEHQAMHTTTQAAAVQNTWYPVLTDEKNPEVISIAVNISIANETIEFELTRDGVVEVATVALAFGVPQYLHFRGYFSTPVFSATDEAGERAFLYHCRKHSMRVRKTTAAGAGTITLTVKRSLYK